MRTGPNAGSKNKIKHERANVITMELYFESSELGLDTKRSVSPVTTKGLT